jgi:general secretion pathway protein A
VAGTPAAGATAAGARAAGASAATRSAETPAPSAASATASTTSTAAAKPQQSASASVPAAAVATPAPALATTAFDLPTGFARLVDAKEASWGELARIWGIAPLDGDPCLAARARQIQCYRNPNITLALIRQLDRPGILTLHDADKRTAHALLVGLSDKDATLRIDGAERSVSLVSLADYWRGEFATFWRAPPGYSGVNIASSTAPSARWLARQLAAARGDTEPLKSRFDDATLKGWVHAFQLTQGLSSDGLAGPVTLMRLNQVIGVEEPRLQGEN